MKTHIQRMAQAAKVAAAYRSYQELPAGGYVILWRMKATGWTRGLDKPQDFRPGALAVSDSGQVLTATGGDYWGGAKEWSSIFDPAPVGASA